MKDRNLLQAFPTADQKKLRKGEIDKLPEKQYYTYYTNFSRYNPDIWVVSDNPEAVDGLRYWTFKTNIAPDDFDYVWDLARKVRFLKAMWEIYCYRKVD